MELLYIWINKSSHDFIIKKGFNFYGEHKFTVKVDETYTLSYENNRSQIGSELYKTDCIKNVTAIIGENGTGKTTLFNSIYSGNCLPYQQSDKPEYKQMYEDRYEANKKILIYKIKGNIEIIHNLELGKFINQTPFVSYNINEVEQKKRERLFKLIEQQTIIYLSNSRYTAGFEGYATHHNVNTISLTIDSLKHISDRFYKKIVRYPEGLIEDDPYNLLQSNLIKNKTATDFQQICDILYYNKIYLDGTEDLYISKICKDLFISFENAIHLVEINAEYSDITQVDFKSNNPLIQRLSKRIIEFLKWIETIPIQIRRDICTTQYLNLIFEMYYCWDSIELENYKVTSFDTLMPIVRDIIETYKSTLNHNLDQVEYFANGLNEIDELSAILSSCQKIYSNLPEDDLAHRFDKVISYEKNKEQYLKFCIFIDRLSRNKGSVLLKYIRIDNLLMSSGERAYQNFFSWLNLLTFFDEFIEGKPIQIGDSNLLLIDEIDLYMHPEWQRKSIKLLLDELSRQFGGKEIQIIFSTHSPLILSDMLKQNSIYLRTKVGKFDLIDSDYRAQTFGNNIHTLLNDSFFMRSTIGEFAQSIIQKISADLISLSQDLGNEELKKKCSSYDEFIELIGEPLIHKKLQDLFLECFPEKQESQLNTYRTQLHSLQNYLNENNHDKRKIKELKDSLKSALDLIESLAEDNE